MDKKIKFYGLINITKKQYLRAQLVGVSVLIAFWIWAIFGNFNTFVFGIGIPLLILTTIAEFLETYFTLRQFQEK